MAQYTTSTKYGSVFGMDVHARSISVHGIELPTGEMKLRRFVNCPSAQEIASWMAEHFSAPYYAAYESGCTGFYLAKELRALGVMCDVVAVSSIARSTDDKQQKTDKRDAKRLLSELISPISTYKVVWIPDDECEADRDLARGRTDAVMSAKRAKQQLSALLLRHGYVWDEKTPSGNLKKTWGREHWAWIEKIDLKESGAKETLRLYVTMIKEGEIRANECSALIALRSECPRWKPYVDALKLIKGIDTYLAFLLTVEFGDFSRFKNGRSVSKWLGTVPKEASSGEHIYLGRISKAGNSHCRRALVEGISCISRHSVTPKSPKKGQVVSGEVQALCNQATRRLKSRWRHFIEIGRLHPNKAKMAVVSEMIRWVWIVGLKVQKGKQAL